MSETGQYAPGTCPSEFDDLPPGTGTPAAREHDAPPWRRRWRRKTWVLVAAGAVVAAAATGVMTALLAGSTSVPLSAPAAPQPALGALTRALAQTSEASYGFTLDSTVTYKGREQNSDTVSGAIDPGHEQGTELLTARATRPSGGSSRAQIRFIGTYVYTRLAPGSGIGTIAKPWDKAPAPPPAENVLPASDLYGFVSDQPVSPDELRVVLLRSTATVRDAGPASGPGWVGTRYTFTTRLSARSSLSGTAYVDKQGRIRRFSTITTQEGGPTMSRDLTFGAYGASGPVTAPPASQVQYTSQPYWGFYF